MSEGVKEAMKAKQEAMQAGQEGGENITGTTKSAVSNTGMTLAKHRNMASAFDSSYILTEVLPDKFGADSRDNDKATKDGTSGGSADMGPKKGDMTGGGK